MTTLSVGHTSWDRGGAIGFELMKGGDPCWPRAQTRGVEAVCRAIWKLTEIGRLRAFENVSRGAQYGVAIEEETTLLTMSHR